MASIRDSASYISNVKNVSFKPNEEITEKYLENKYHIDELKQDDVIDRTLHYLKKNYKPSKDCLINYFFKRLPFFDWIRRYDIKHDLIKDLIAGITVLYIYISVLNKYLFYTNIISLYK
jgi:hypothetical protein